MNVRISPLVFRPACVALCTAFIYSGVSKLVDFQAAVGEAAHFGLQPTWLFATGIIVTQLGGSVLTVFASGRWQALGAITLAGFTIIATPIGHAFWAMQGMDRFHDLNSFLEHIGLVGGLMLVACMAGWNRGEDG